MKTENDIEVKEPQVLGHLNDDKTAEAPQAEMTIEQLEAELIKRRAQQVKEQEAAKKAYEKDTNEKVTSMVTTALSLFDDLATFKQLCHETMAEKAETLSKYGKIRSTSKGGFTITNSEGTMSVTRRRDTKPQWDERSTKAIELIKDFLGDTIKKRDRDMYEILMGFLERNEKGDLEYSRVMDLYRHESKFTDERWKEGLRLIKESYSSHMKGYGYEFKHTGKDGKLVSIILNFSSI